MINLGLIDKLIINKEFILVMAIVKYSLLPGDWIVIEVDKVHLYNYETAKLDHVYGYSGLFNLNENYRIYPETLFSKELVVVWPSGG